MEDNVATNPSDICHFGTHAIVQDSQPSPHSIEEAGRVRQRGGIGKVIGHERPPCAKYWFYIQHISTDSQLIGQFNNLFTRRNVVYFSLGAKVTALTGLGTAFLTGGVISALISFVRYSDFLARLQVVNSSLVEKLEMDIGENWSNKNIAIGKFFWRKEYLSVSDEAIHRLGHSVRTNQLLAFALVVAGIVMFVANDLISK